MNLKKTVIAFIAAAMLCSCAVGVYAAGSTYGYLNVSYHYVPVLKDTARGNTACNIFDSNNGTSKMWTKTTVKVYDYDGNSNSNTKWNYDTAAMEGWNATETQIRHMKSANGTHVGGSDQCQATAYTSWSR